MTSAIKTGKIDYKSFHPRIVVKFNDLVDLPFSTGAEINDFFLEGHVMAWPQLKEFFPTITIGKLFTSVSAEKLTELVAKAKELDPTYRPPNFHNYCVIDYPFGTNTNQLLELLEKSTIVDLVYLESGPTPPPSVDPSDDHYSVLQGYLDAGPDGIGAREAWTVNGGDGAGTVKLIDVEQGWATTHEDIGNLVDRTLPNTGVIHDLFVDHGTAVLGMIMMRDNDKGGVGIVPNINSVFVMSQWRENGTPSGQWNTADAIMEAVRNLSFGDVLLLEAQLADPHGATNFWPVEVEDATFQAIRLATALGITVIEAAGNGVDYRIGNDIDTRITRESGAIIVGASSRPAPHTPINYSNIGDRVNCYGWGERVETAWHSWNPPYTGTFEGTSSASAMIAGAALTVQSITEATYNFRLSPKQMRDILSDESTGTLSANGRIVDRIGVMPNLTRIIDSILNVTPDVYIRDRVGDIGDTQTGLLYRSPDIIVVPTAVGDPQASYGSGSGREDDDAIGGDVTSTSDHFIYLRLSNRGGLNATNVAARVYYSPPATLLTPDMWTLIGSTNLPRVPSGVLTVSPAIRWAAGSIPTPGHYCFIALIGNDTDPMPDINDLNLSWDQFFQFVGNNNNVAWRNFNVVSMPSSGMPIPFPPPSPAPEGTGLREIEFLSCGAPKEAVKMELRISAQLPEKSRIFLQVPLVFLHLLEQRSPYIQVDKKREVAFIPIKYSGQHSVGEILYPAKSKFKMKLLISIPEKYRKYHYEVSAAQSFKGKDVGRVTWRLTSKIRDKSERHDQE